ncbi:hypothetical protein [Arthrobacter sp. USHLN218]|uniref:hypothetical protein n=1 Tax=Arthrobacter sp. USHLN218 TaxID=3081232 RepID=UPI0030188692
MRHTWTGWDGTVWDLTKPRDGVFLMAEGLEGIDMPDMVQHTHESAVVHGSSWEGYQVTGRKVFWPIYLYHDESSEAWINRDRAFWRTLRPGTVGTWTVELPGSREQRTLRLRFVGVTPGNSNDPAFRGWQTYGIEFMVEQPFWEGPPIIRSWNNGEQIPLDVWPPITVSPYQTIGNATVANPGDVESFVKWTVTGPTTSVQVGVGDGIAIANFQVPDGSKLVINTDPRNFEATLDGVDVFPQIQRFDTNMALPPGDPIRLSLAMGGTGSVQAEFTPLYFRVN